MFDAVLGSAPASLPDFEARLRALVSFLADPAAASLTAANKRIANIIKKSATGSAMTIDPQLLQTGAERALHDELANQRPGVEAALARRDYAAAFASLAALRQAIDAFFDSVLVNDSDARLRNNRLALLAQLRGLFTRVADLSRLPG
jgi:glycyl-tRNA synthetase beta chain